MQISRRSLLIRWAYWLDKKIGDPPPFTVTLCTLFWRTVLLTPLVLLLIGVFSPVWVPLWVTVRFVCVPLLRAVPDRAYRRIEVAGGAVGDVLLAAKDRLCPLVQITREEGQRG